MKKLLLLLAVTGACVAATFTVPTQALRGTSPVSQDLVVTNVNSTVGLTINKSSASVSNLVQASHAGAVKFSVNTNGAVTSASLTASLPVFSDASKVLTSKTIANSLLALGIQSGTSTNVNYFTNKITFATAFSSAPIVIVTGATNALPHIYTAATTTAVTFGSAATNNVLSWIAIGPP